MPPVYATASPGGAGGTTAAAARKKLLIFDAEEYLAEALAKYTARLSGEAVAERGAFTVALSGGSLNKGLRFFPALLEIAILLLCIFLWVLDRVEDINMGISWDLQEVDGVAVPGGGGMEQMACVLGGREGGAQGPRR